MNPEVESQESSKTPYDNDRSAQGQVYLKNKAVKKGFRADIIAKFQLNEHSM